jgi:hypothetical protein
MTEVPTWFADMKVEGTKLGHQFISPRNVNDHGHRGLQTMRLITCWRCGRVFDIDRDTLEKCESQVPMRQELV